ncbi:MAG TPA: AI-2E family transporter [Candidatus Polarisedimenticolaceae bacterium]|nr:AI-2E family transporter [Candidatus Polarisedimenticolaceae bacterium]
MRETAPIDLTVRLVVIALLVYWCFAIFRPFLMPTVLGIVLAVALYPIYLKLERVLGGRRKVAATLLVLACLAALLVPTLLLSDSLIDGVRMVSARVQEGTIKIPPAPASVAEWPLIGKPVYDAWTLASTNLDAVADKLQPALKKVGLWLVATAKQGVFAGLLAAIGFAIAGVFWVRRESALATVTALSRRVGGERGASLIPLARGAITSVAKGVLGVAAIQSVLAAIGLVAAGVPGAGLWALLVMILAVAQLPPILILGPAILYVMAKSDSTLTTVLFAVWSIAVSFSDAVLKPLLMGRGTDIPVAVILIGAIGGLVLHGLIGLFVGAVVFSIGHTLISGWIGADETVRST